MKAPEVERASLLRLADALDRCTDLSGQPINAEKRAAIFNAVTTVTPEEWIEARSTLITKNATLWEAVVAIGIYRATRPSGAQIIRAIEVATEGES